MIGGIDFINLPCEEYWSPTKKAEKDNIRGLAKNFIFSGEYMGARKVDGHHYRFIKDSEILRLQGRSLSVSGEYLNKIDWVPHIQEKLIQMPDGTVFIGEIYFPNNEGSKHVTTIMGCAQPKAVQRQVNGDKLHYYIFDVLAWKGQSLIDKSLQERVELLHGEIKNYIVSIGAEYIHVAQYYDGQKLWDYVGWALSHGYEGVVIQRKDAEYGAGKRTARKTLKIKKEIEIEVDAFLTGRIKSATMEYKGKEPEHWDYWCNVRTGELLRGEENYDEYIESGIVIPVTKDFFFGLPASIEFGVFNNEQQDVSLCWISNLTDELKERIKNSPNNCRGLVAKITAMEFDDVSSSLRHSKIKEWRTDGDKTMTDCSIFQIL